MAPWTAAFQAPLSTGFSSKDAGGAAMHAVSAALHFFPIRPQEGELHAGRAFASFVVNTKSLE